MNDLYEPIILMEKYNLNLEEASELSDLLNFFQAKNFTHSNQLSKYISNNNLSERFPILTGIGHFKSQNGDNEWDLENALPPKFYSIVCENLNLKNNESGATMVDFKSNQTTLENHEPLSMFESLEKYISK